MPTSFPMANPWVNPEFLDAAKLAARITTPINDLAALLQATGTSFTPALTAATTNPTLGAGSSVSGSYVALGKLIYGWGVINWGTSGTNAGSGLYAVNLPAASVNGSPLHGSYVSVCAGLYTRGDLTLLTSTTCNLAYYSAANQGTRGFASQAGPGAWTANDKISYNFCYIAA